MIQQKIRAIGSVSWTKDDIINDLPVFFELWKQKPIDNNDGGMKAPHLFATWFLLKRLQPLVVIESGVWKGLGTWLIEQAVPEAKIICIDPVLDWIVYKSPKARYQTHDFAQTDWASWDLPIARTLLFFDDHQNAFQRLLTAQKWGFEHLIFEDNYPASQGDCYSIKKALMGAGFVAPAPKSYGMRARVKQFFFPAKTEKILPNTTDADYFTAHCKTYYEFPPIFKPTHTRWGDSWDETHYPTPVPILEQANTPYERLFWDEAQFYTWLCYVGL